MVELNIKNLHELVTAKRDHAAGLADLYQKSGRIDKAKHEWLTVKVYQEIALWLEDEQLFNNIYNIYFPAD